MFNWSRESRFTSTADGALKWEKNVPATPQNGAGAAVDGDGTVFIQSKDGKLTAYHPDGTVKWVTENLGTTYTLTRYSEQTVSFIFHLTIKNCISSTKKPEPFNIGSAERKRRVPMRLSALTARCMCRRWITISMRLNRRRLRHGRKSGSLKQTAWSAPLPC